MWNVLIADDEPKIRKGMKGLLERLDPEVRVVAEAEDGEAALALARETMPDILFIDIRMPFLNGLELIERLNALGGDWLVFVVTGHDEFEYARKAISLKVFDFLLKPIGEAHLKKCLEQAKEELSVRREANHYIAWARKRLDENREALRDGFLRDRLDGKLSNTEIEESSAFLSVSFPDDPFVMLVSLPERVMSVGMNKEESRRLMTFTVRSIVEEALEYSGSLVFIDSGENVAVILPGSERTSIPTIQARIEAAVIESTHQTPIVAVGTSAERSLCEAYDTALADLSRKNSCGAFVAAAQAYIEKHYGDPGLSLEEVADELHISPGYLSRLMRQATGFSFVDFLLRFRVRRALSLMADPAVKIFEVAETVGFNSQHYFSRAFKKALGLAPTEYRRGGGQR